jgi:uncharacterized protein (TIGR02271 family)
VVEGINFRDLQGRTVVGRDGAKIGKIGHVYLDDVTNQPDWVTVNTGLFGTRETFVPLRGVSLRGDDVVIPFGKDLVGKAPNVDAEGGHLSVEEERNLYRHYGQAYDTVDRGVRASGDDDALTRSEERLRVDKERVETGHARLRKYVETEDVQFTVPVRRERVVVEREPITDADRAAALSGEEFSETEREVTTFEERPVVTKETVPVERVRLTTEVETDQEVVSETLRKERIEEDIDDDDDDDGIYDPR